MQLRYTENGLSSSKYPKGVLRQGNATTIQNLKLSKFEERLQMNLQVESTFQVPTRINNGKAIPRTMIGSVNLNMKNKKIMFTATREKTDYLQRNYS